MRSSRRELGRGFARRIYGPRALGCALSLVFVSTVAATRGGAHPLIWALMLFNGVVWPTLAYRISRRSADSFISERRNLLIDALFAGLWVGQMALNLLPSVLLLAMVAMNAIAAGGWALLRRTLALQAAGAIGALTLTRFEIVPDTTRVQMLACLPMLLVYPLAVGGASYRLAVQLAVHKKAFKIISTLDGMTSLLNHTAWMEHLRKTFQECRTHQRMAILALLDIDDFKSINDTHGHLVGDAIIARLACLLREGFGPGALPGRYGGDEFCVLLFDVTVSQAYDQLNEIRVRFNEWTDGAPPGAQATLSIGLVPYSPKYASAQDWIRASDQALYKAKHSGKNQLWLQELPIA
ncbi:MULTISPECIES: diguanylate cyclase [Pseudomonas]|uniref:diguanylate cyclase n=1 Tax=Pseudomonas quercus TaxID=2722792 RepID=A0ABX0YIA3_9PSED|nr:MULTISPECIES: diguanylate cyclase [Pseudomonas]MBF7143414.1 diguanylate cyclase [Pseudomonas sp. LY10J]NJP01718.1 diguanylate cyclase [Pseudomonas quercus]